MTEFRTVGDLAQQLVSRRQNADLRQQMNRLVDEVGSGLRADLSQTLKGDFTVLSGIEADLSRLEGFAKTVSELSLRAAATQRVLTAGRDLATDTAAQLLTLSPPTTPDAPALVAQETRGRLGDVLSRLNGGFAGASLFAGIATDSAAVATADTILAALEADIAGLATAPDVRATVEAWFAPGGGFDTVGYLGSQTPQPDLAVSPTRTLGVSVSADAPEVRDLLAGLAMAALVDRPPLSGDLSEQGAMMISAAESLQQSQSGMSALQARVGTAEAELEREGVRNGAEQTVLRMSRAEITEADPFESATQLEAVQSRLELLYTITARSAQFSLVRVLG